MDPTWQDRKNTVYQNAVKKGLYKDTYAIGNSAEYWAEMVQAYFDCNRVNNWNHGPIGRREQLKMYDPEGYELVRKTFNLAPDQDWRYSWLQTLPKVQAPPAKFNIDPYYTKFTWAREFTVLGRQASDEALLKANNTIRKMFAYRHDILKALIADGVKLVVLGPNEKLSDLPEWEEMAAEGADHTARFLDYSPRTKLLVVARENVLSNLSDPYATECQVIRVFARALYHVTAKRPVDPNWDNRGRDVQQYELRVQRMDIRFDNKLEELYDSTTASNTGLRACWLISTPSVRAQPPTTPIIRSPRENRSGSTTRACSDLWKRQWPTRAKLTGDTVNLMRKQHEKASVQNRVVFDLVNTNLLGRLGLRSRGRFQFTAATTKRPTIEKSCLQNKHHSALVRKQHAILVSQQFAGRNARVHHRGRLEGSA